MRFPSFILTIGLISLISISCSNHMNPDKSQTPDEGNQMAATGNQAGPPVIIYKTREDYFDKVPVTLSEDKTEVVSFPGIKDIYYKGSIAYPTRLHNGFLLDNRGIGPNSAFLDYSYEAYSKLPATPTANELVDKILDKDPFMVTYNCGSRFEYKDAVVELNRHIDENNFGSFTKLK